MENIEGPRGCRPDEFGETVDLINYVFRSLQDRRPSMGGDYPQFLNESNADNLRIIRKDGKVISQVGIYPVDVRVKDTVLKVGGIGSVATDPDYQRKGYAGMLLEDCIRKMKGEAYDLSILWTGIDDYYRKLGWENGGRECRYYVDRGNVGLLPTLKGCDVVKGARDKKFVDQIKALHDRDRLGVIRDRELTGTIMGLPKHDVYLAIKDDRVEGYIVTRREKAEEDSYSVNEYGGNVDIVLSLVRHFFEEMQPKFIKFLTPYADDGIPGALNDLEFPKEVYYVGMFRVINAESLLDKFGLSDVFVRDDEDKVRLKWNGNEGEFGRRELVKLIFGPEKISDFGSDLFPLGFYWWQPDHM